MPKIKLFKKTKDEIKDEKLMQKELLEYEQDYDKCRDLIIKIENHFDRVEPQLKTTKNKFYLEKLSDQDFIAMLTDMRYPLTDLEKYIVFQWMQKNEDGKAAFVDFRWSVGCRLVEITKKYRTDEERSMALVTASADIHWVLVIFRLSGFSAFKMNRHTFKKLVRLSSTGAYLRSVVMNEVPDLPAGSVYLYTDSRSRHESLMLATDSLKDMGIEGGTFEFPQEAVLHYDFSPEKSINQPLVDNIRFIKDNPRFKTYRKVIHRDSRNVGIESSLDNTED